MSYLNRQLNIMDFTLASLMRRKGKNLGLFVVYTVIVAVLASIIFFTGAIKHEARLLLKDAPEIVVQRIEAGRHALMPLSWIERISSVRGVRSVRGRLWGYYYDPLVRANYTVMVPEDFKHNPGETVIGQGIARSRGAWEGDVFPFRTYSGGGLNLKVVDTLTHESELLTADLMLISEKDFRSLFGVEDGYVTDITLRVRNERELTTVARKIADEIPDARPIIRDEILRTYEGVFNWRGGLMVALMGGAGLAFIIFAWDRASGLSAEEKKEIGVLKAVGWETSDVLMMKSWEGLIVSFSAFLVGTLLAYAHVFLFSSALIEPALKGWSVLYPDFSLTPAIQPHQVVSVLFLSVVPYTIAAIIPAWRAAITDPDAVMKE